MSITQEDVQRILDTARAWYDGGLESSNKLYYPVLDGEDRKIQRNLNSAEASARNSETFEATRDMSSLEAGNYIVTNDRKSGNCIEMTQATLHFCMSDPEMKSKIHHAWVADSKVHTFLLVSDGPRLNDENALSIKSDFGANEKKGLWVIDCWMNIACPAADYASRINEKTAKWEERGKVIVHGDTDIETVKNSEGNEVDIDVPISSEDYIEAPRFGRNLIKSSLQLEKIPLRELHAAPTPQKRNLDTQPSLKRARVSEAGTSAQTRAGPSTSAQAPEPAQRERRASYALPEKRPRSPSQGPRRS